MTSLGRTIAGLWMLVCCGIATGAEVSYTHVELRRDDADIRREESSDSSAEALALSATLQVSEHLFLLAEGKRTEEGGDSFTALVAGGGAFWSPTSGVDLYAMLAFSTLKDSHSKFGVGVRARASQELEFDARVGVDPMDTRNSAFMLSVEFGVRFYLTPALALGLNHQNGVVGDDDATVTRLSIRYDFGSER